MKRKQPFNIDAGDNGDWTKQSWGLPPYKSEEFHQFIGEDELDHFRTLPVYRWAVKNGLIKDDEWVSEHVPNGKLPVPEQAEGSYGIIGDGIAKITPEDPEHKEEVETEEKDKYYVNFLDDGRAGIVIRVTDDLTCYRFGWATKKWVHDRDVFLKMQGVGGDGYDWEEVTEEQAERHIKSRIG